VRIYDAGLKRAARGSLQIQDAKIFKNLPSAHHRITLSCYIFATKAPIDNRKKLIKQQYLLHMSPQYGELRPTSGWDRSGSLGHPSQISAGFASWQHYCSNVAQRKPTILCTVFGRLLGWYTTYTFFGVLALLRNLPGAKFTLRPPSLAL